MKYAKILAVFGALALLGAGSATLLDVYGTVSGTADVKPALNFVEVQATKDGGEYVLLENNADVSVDVSRVNISDARGSDTLTSTNSTSKVGSGEYLLIVEKGASITSYTGSKDFIKASTGDSGITGGLANTGENLTAWIDDVDINSFQYAGDCSSSKAEAVDGSCVKPTFEVKS